MHVTGTLFLNIGLTWTLFDWVFKFNEQLKFSNTNFSHDTDQSNRTRYFTINEDGHYRYIKIILIISLQEWKYVQLETCIKNYIKLQKLRENFT